MPDSDSLHTQWSDFGRRFLTAAIGGPAVLLISSLGGWLFTLAIVVVFAISIYELFTAVRASHLRWAFWLFTIIAPLYIGLPLVLLCLIRAGQDGGAWVIMLFCTNWATDGFALIGGRTLGRTRLAPQISPGKTVEGAFTGIICGTILGVAVSVVLGLNINHAFIAAIAVSILTVVGDLAESWLKRRLEVKDFGAILPGHGGLLDRIDGLLFASVGLFVVLLLVR